MLRAISPIDGRYAGKTADLADYFSEFALIKYRVWVELQYLVALYDAGLPQLQGIKRSQLEALVADWANFDVAQAEGIKATERVTNHDVKAVEYYVKQQMEVAGLGAYQEFVHFGLTSQDINNTAVPLSLKEAATAVYLPELEAVISDLDALAQEAMELPMLARTHGQPASPTTLGKEIAVFVARLKGQRATLEAVPYAAKFGGATGNMNAHVVAYPDRDWHAFAKNFVEEYLGLTRSYPTTQIEHYDHIANLFHAYTRINTILIDLCRDIWTYVSMEYFRQRVVAGEVGSSAMPHKVNPIDFENAEGNLGVANAVFGHLAEKLPISRLQRDLTDSTVLRNVGVPIAHTLIAFKSIRKGLGKLLINKEQLEKDLEKNWMVVAEAIQTILRRESYPKPYEALKALTRGNTTINEKVIEIFIQSLNVDNEVKEELRNVKPSNYIGNI